MKLSSNSIGTLIFLAIAVVIFVLMAKRPAVNGNALNLGVPMQVESKTPVVETQATPEPEAKTEDPAKTEEPTTETVTPEASDTTAPIETTMPTEPPKEDAVAVPEATEPATTETAQ